MYKIELLDLSEEGIKKCTSLLQSVYPKATHINDKYIHWQYNQNPEGNAIGFNAFLGNEFAAHYVTIPIAANVFGSKEKGLLSLNTATHFNHRGKALFTQLADATYRYAAENGYQFVIGVANANSTHGFTKKLGFQLVSPLQAMIGMGEIKMKETKKEYDYETIWTNKALFWRLDNNIKHYFIKRSKQGWLVNCAYKKGVNAIVAVLDKNYQMVEKAGKYNPFQLWIGLDDNMDWKNSFYFNIPSRLRPAPLNLIFKDLTGKNRKLSHEAIRFQLIDFDVL